MPAECYYNEGPSWRMAKICSYWNFNGFHWKTPFGFFLRQTKSFNLLSKPFLCSIKLRPLNLEPKSDQWMICHETWHKIPSFRMQLCTFAEISLKSHVFSVNKKKLIACFNAPLWVHFVKWSEDLFSKKSSNNGIKIQCGRKV